MKVIDPVAEDVARQEEDELDPGLTQSYAIISPCGRFRYLLGRKWQSSGQVLTFVMLNPSTADGIKDDPTIRKCIGFGTRNGFGRIEVVNLFAYRTSNPDILKESGYLGADAKANEYLVAAFNRVIEIGGTVVCAWGASARDPWVQSRANAVIAMIKHAGIRPQSFKLLDDGIPSHPLMLSYDCHLRNMP